EDPAAIRRAILAAAPGAIEIGDRGEAITRAIEMLQPDDLLVLAGKGHERGQIVGDLTHPFEDAEAARASAALIARAHPRTRFGPLARSWRPREASARSAGA